MMALTRVDRRRHGVARVRCRARPKRTHACSVAAGLLERDDLEPIDTALDELVGGVASRGEVVPGPLDEDVHSRGRARV